MLFIHIISISIIFLFLVWRLDIVVMKHIFIETYLSIDFFRNLRNHFVTSK